MMKLKKQNSPYSTCLNLRIFQITDCCFARKYEQKSKRFRKILLFIKKLLTTMINYENILISAILLGYFKLHFFIMS